MTAIFTALWLANLAFAVASGLMLSGPVAIHFGPGGLADGWGTATQQAGLMSFLVTLFYAAFLAIPRSLARMPARWVNLPRKEYWLAPENRARCALLMRRHLHRFGCAMQSLFFVAQLLALRANLVHPPRLDERLFLSALGLFLLYTVAWLFTFYREFLNPPS